MHTDVQCNWTSSTRQKSDLCQWQETVREFDPKSTMSSMHATILSPELLDNLGLHTSYFISVWLLFGGLFVVCLIFFFFFGGELVINQ